MYKKRITVFAFCFLLSWLFVAAPASAQSCASATIENNSGVSWDSAEICDAAQPLADAGYDVFVYLTDFEASSEDDWFNHLDQAETNAGLLSSGGLDLNAVAFEASTANSDWSSSVTLGENLWDTALDSNASIIRQTMRGNLDAGNSTQAFVEALDEAGNLLNAGAASAGTIAQNDETSSQQGRASSLLVGALALGAIGAGGLYVYPRMVKPAMTKRKDEEERSQHLDDLQQRVANLLLACERLVEGDAIEESVLYQLFETYGGRNYKEEDSRVREWLRRSKVALNDAFEVRQKLLDPEVQEKRGQAQLIEDWEKVYVTLVGSQERITKLSNSELHVLLDPLQILERQPDDVALTKQLSAIKNELEGLPLTVDLQKVNASDLDAEGVIGYLDGVQVEIGNLQTAQLAAPDRLEHARKGRQEVEESIPRPFVIAEDKLLAGIDAQLAEADQNLEKRLYLRVIEQSELIERELDVVEELVAVVEVWQVREKEIQRVLDGGYRPKDLAEMQREIQQDLVALESALDAGDYANVDEWLDELNTDSLRTHNYAIAWRHQEQANAEKANEIRNGIAHMQSYRRDTATMSWSNVQQYAAGNWDDVAPGWDDSAEILNNATARLEQYEKMNTMDVQQFDSAEKGLTELYADLATAMGHMEDIVNRLSEIRAAKTNIDPAIAQAEELIVKAVTYRDREDSKIDTAVDDQIKQATQQVVTARQSRDAKNYIQAINAQTLAEELATSAYRSSNEQVATINNLFHSLNEHVQQTEPAIEQLLDESDQLKASILSEKILMQVSRLRTSLTEARQAHVSVAALEDVALAEGLQAANGQYDSAETLATEIKTSIATAKQEYAELYEQAKLDRQRAIKAIAEAELMGQRLGAGPQWRPYYEKAVRTLPDQELSPDLTRDELERLQRLSADAYELAERAESTAAQGVQRASQQQRRSNNDWGRPTQRWGRGSWGGVPRNVPRMRPSNRSMPTFGGGGSMMGGGSGGSRRRAGGMGGSRRHSGGGGGSRRH